MPKETGYRLLVPFFLTGCLILMMISTSPALADPNQTIKIDPIGTHGSGEAFPITGITTIEKCKKIGIEIFPTQYWDEACDFAKEDETSRIVFNPIASSKEKFNPSGVNLIRFNADGTQSAVQMESVTNHLNVVIPVEKGDSGEKVWKYQVETDENGNPFSPGTYHVHVYDASTQVDKHDNPMANGWDINDKKIYPSTARVNIWDEKNQQDMISSEFVIR